MKRLSVEPEPVEPLPFLSSLPEDRGGSVRTGGPAAPFPSHHHRFFSILLDGKLRSMPCDVPVDDGRGNAVPCGLTWEENVEIAITRYDRAARREARG